MRPLELVKCNNRGEPFKFKEFTDLYVRAESPQRDSLG